jgi:transcriptional regulator
MSKPADLVQGTLDLLLLKVIGIEPQYGCAISQRLKTLSHDDLAVSDASLYPALHQLELAGWIIAEWRTSECGHRERLYALTAAGRQRLDEEVGEWRRLSSAITRVVKLKEGRAS